MKNGMYTDVIALFTKYVNTRGEPQSSEGFAQFPAVGVGAGCWDSAGPCWSLQDQGEPQQLTGAIGSERLKPAERWERE